MSDLEIVHTPEDLDYLFSPQAIRERAARILEIANSGGTHFIVHEDKIAATAEFVREVTIDNYPDLNIPFHSRWGHFRAGGVDRLASLEQRCKGLSAADYGRAMLDLVVVSVLLDAGAGERWHFRESDSDLRIGRSEGLAVASLHMFVDGVFSSDEAHPLRVDADALVAFDMEKLACGFQISGENPLVGAEGRVQLMNRLGEVLKRDPEHFGEALPRPGHLLDYLSKVSGAEGVPARTVLRAVLDGLGPIWPGRLSLGGVSLGDIWMHSALGSSDSLQCLVPFHKLSQWLTYSLIEPIETSGLTVSGVDELTGLAEYRNGGLLVDMGVLELRDSEEATRAHQAGSELVVEWRALTIAVLDMLGRRVRELLGKTEETFPLARVLEGGTWHAGRRIAKKLRPSGAPPLQIDSDGTVF